MEVIRYLEIKKKFCYIISSCKEYFGEYNMVDFRNNFLSMVTISVEVPSDLAKKFSGKKVIKYQDILDYDDNLKYNFNDEKVTMEELSEFLWKVVSSK